MAKVRSNKAKGIKAVSTKDKYLNKIKALTKYLISQDEDLLEFMLTDKTEARKLKFRSISYLLIYPKLIHYINKHLNSLFDFENFDNREWFTTISQICRMCNISDSNVLHFSKFKVDESVDFTNLLKRYSNELNIPQPSNSEINALFILFKHGIITDEHINRMKATLEGKDKTSASEKRITELTQMSNSGFQSNMTNHPKELNFENLPKKIQELSINIKQYMKNRNLCNTCSLFGRNPVIIDTNLKNPGPVDIFILGLNSDVEEGKIGIPFTGKAGILLRKFIMPIIEKYHLTYAMCNCVLCNTNDLKESGSPKKIIGNCKVLIEEIRRSFPCKLTLALGAEAKDSLDISGGITKLNATFIKEKNAFITINPNALLVKNNATNAKRFALAFQKLDELLASNKIAKTPKNPENRTSFNIDPSKIVTRFGPNLTLFDLKHIDEQVIYILTDEEGNKKYLIEKISFPIFIKGGEYKNCKMIENSVQAVSYLSSYERTDLNRTLHHNLRSLIDVK